MYLNSFEKPEAKYDSTGYSEAPIARQSTNIEIGGIAKVRS